ncbi:MAG: MFS transporter [Magnetospirillum sp.]|nr:MFS transporter [Magnetospirillum sp.]
MATVPLSATLTLAACIAVSLLNEVSGAVLTLAMPEAARDVGASQAAAQFVLLAGKLSLGALMLAGGGAGDRFGRKRTMLVGIALVALAAILSAAAQSTGMLAGARILDGIGNALVGPLALALALAAFPETMRARVIGLFLGISGLGVAIGPLIAGTLVELGGWRAGFAAPFTLALAGGAAIFVLSKPEHSQPRRPPWDPVGMLTCILGLVAVVLGFILAGRHGWVAADTLGVLGAGLVCLGLFAWWETSRAPVPMMDPALLRSREVLCALAAALLAAMVLNGTVLPLLYFLQRIHGYGKVASVVRLLPLIVAAMTVAPLAGKLADSHGRRLVMLGGLVAMAAGSGVMTTLASDTPYGVIALALALIGAGVMAVITPAADLVMATSGSERSGSAAALNGAVMQVGGAIGIGVITSIFLTEALGRFAAIMAARGYTREEIIEPVRKMREIARQTALDRMPPLPDIPPQMQHDILDAYAQAFAAGVARSFLVAAILAVVAMLVLMVGMRRPPSQEPAAAIRP